MRTNFQFTAVIALLWGATCAGPFVAAAVVIPPGGLAVSASGNDLNLSFATTSPYFYTAQMSLDMRQWTNCQPGVPGDGTVKTVTLTNAIAGGQSFYRFVAQQPVSLVLPQSTAFSILGYSCGGIHEQVSAGFDPNTGLPTGVVILSTTCSGSGRGGVTTTHRGSAVVVWDLGGNVISATSGTTVNPTSSTDGLGDVIYNSGTAAFLVVPVPVAPTGVTAFQTNDQFQVSWMPRVMNPLAVTFSFLTATPVHSAAPVLTNTVAGPGTNGVLLPLQPQTTYQITVASKTIGGTSPASAAFTITSEPATIPPSVPAGVSASWSNLNPTGATDTIIASWQAPNPGNSPVDQYLVTITGSDGGGTFTQTVSGTALTAYFNVDYIPNWSVTVQAHNAAGWGPISAAYQLGGL